jgi:hypothetical protein
MAKVKPTVPVPYGQVVQGIQYQPQASGIVIAQRSNNNRNSQSHGFRQLDQWIMHYDASYEQNTQQSDWESFAETIDGLWQLCANCMPDGGAKKLFRQVNFNRQIMGLPAVDNTFTLGFPPDVVFFIAQKNTKSDGTELGINIELLSTLDIQAFLQMGEQMSNPNTDVRGADNATYFMPGTARYDFWNPIIEQFCGSATPGGNAYPLTCCVSDLTGVPGMNFPVTLYWYRVP